MGKRKKQFDRDGGSVHMEVQEPAVKLEDYISLEKADAFVQMYDPSPTENGADEVWNETRLREFFTAYVEKTHGDPLPLYLEQIKPFGHRLKVSAGGELCLFLKYRRSSASDNEIRMMLEGEDGDDSLGEE